MCQAPAGPDTPAGGRHLLSQTVKLFARNTPASACSVEVEFTSMVTVSRTGVMSGSVTEQFGEEGL
jgi:hypothetical protein